MASLSSPHIAINVVKFIADTDTTIATIVDLFIVVALSLSAELATQLMPQLNSRNPFIPRVCSAHYVLELRNRIKFLEFCGIQFSSSYGFFDKFEIFSLKTWYFISIFYCFYFLESLKNIYNFFILKMNQKNSAITSSV